MRFSFRVQYCAVGDNEAENIMTCSFEAPNPAIAEIVATTIATNAMQALWVQPYRPFERTNLIPEE